SQCTSGLSDGGVVTIYVDGNNVFGDQEDSPLFRFTFAPPVSVDQTFQDSFPSAALPPGNYRFYADARGTDGSPLQFNTGNGTANIVTVPSEVLSITKRPKVVITSPAPNVTGE